jgi:hypothetical protein
MYSVPNLVTKLILAAALFAFRSHAQTASPLWQDISPNEFNYTASFGIAGFGGAMSDQPKTLYVGTCDLGVWKSTNGGGSWFKASTGTNGNNIDGRNHALCVDPTNSNIVYTNCLFGGMQGVWKSTTGGVDWERIQGTIDNGDIAFINIDPVNHLHLLVALHSGGDAVWESRDGGSTWKSLGNPCGGAMIYPAFLGQDNAGKPTTDFWLFMSEGNGLYRTENAGATWTQVSTAFSRSHAGAGLYRAPNGTLYACVNNTVARSTDNGKTWADLQKIGNLPGTCDGYSGIVGDGTTIWTMPENTGKAACGPYKWLTTPEAGDGTKWTTYNNQSFADGPMVMAYDPVNKIVYADCWCTGVWKLQLSSTTPIKGLISVSAPTRATHTITSCLFDLHGRLLRSDLTRELKQENRVIVRIEQTENGVVARRSSAAH